MSKVLALFPSGLDYFNHEEYKVAINNDLLRLEEEWHQNLYNVSKVVIYLDFGLSDPNIKRTLDIALSLDIPIYYRRLGLVSPKFQNQWQEYLGCPKCGNICHQLKTSDTRYQCVKCKVETHLGDTSRWTTLDSGTNIKDIHNDERCAILGGGPSLMEQVILLPKNTYLIGINHHASKALQVPMDYIVFNDEHSWDLCGVKDCEGKKISRFPNKNDIFLPLIPKAQLSGITACTIAQEMGFKEIILCGFDCSDAYLDTSYPSHTIPHTKDKNWHLNKWKTLVDKSNIYTMGGPLREIFPLYPKAL